MSSPKIPTFDNLGVCPDHGIMKHARNEARRCALCSLDEEFRVDREADVPGGGIKQHEVRQRLEAEDLEDLLPLMREYLEDSQDGDVTLFVTVQRFDGTLPMGYSEAQERWVNAVIYHFSGRVKAITDTASAQETIETLRENGYGEDGDCDD